MLSFLQKPYPYRATRKSIYLSSILMGIFVALFLIIFQPFGIIQWEHPHKMFFLAGYGVITITMSLLFQGLFKWIANEDTWTVWKEATATLIVLCAIAFGNFFYSVYVGIATLNFIILINFIGDTFLIGVFPIAANIFLKYNQFLKINQRQADSINAEIAKVHANNISVDSSIEDSDKLVFIAENGKDSLVVTIQELLYIQSADNYSEIIQTSGNIVKKTLLRSSLKRLEEQHKLPFLSRCHRSFIVNLKQVKHIEGNAQGYSLSFFSGNDNIPVSRNYSAVILGKLQTLK